MNAKFSPCDATTRRSFLKRSLLVGGAAAFPLIVPGRVLGRDGGVAPSERIVMAGIGIGPRGRQVLATILPEKDVQVVTICDVQARARQTVKAMVDEAYANKDCTTCRDLREVFARPDIDAVLIATGDRWHAPASAMAARAGKDVYSEKPCGLTLEQCQHLASVFDATGRVFQAGTQRRNVRNFQFAVELARSGRLGRLHTLHASIYKLSLIHDWLPAEPEPPRDEVDWDLWLGPSPWRPYNSRYVKGQWRAQYDFDSGAKLLDWAAHTVDLCQWANDCDGTAPVEYEPDGGTIRARYANGVRLVMRPDGWLNTGTCPVRFEGSEGWVETGDTGQIEMHPASLRAEWKSFSLRGTDATAHTRDFLNCVRSRALPAAHQGVMRRSHVACHAAAIAWQLGRPLRFDPAAESFVGDEEANRMRSRAMRAPWLM